MLFRDEAPLKGPVKGTSSFASEFQRGGPRASGDRSLRQLDLRTRLFRYPCSYLIYSESFDALPSEMKNYLWRRLDQILSGRDRSDAYINMATEDLRAVFEILRQTKPEFASWLRRGEGRNPNAEIRRLKSDPPPTYTLKQRVNEMRLAKVPRMCGFQASLVFCRGGFQHR
jgi:hypothetical protein